MLLLRNKNQQSKNRLATFATPPLQTKEGTWVNCKLITAWHYHLTLDSCAVWVSYRQKNSVSFIPNLTPVQCEFHTGKKTVIARMKSINRNWATDFMFSRKSLFLGSISRGGQMPVLPPWGRPCMGWYLRVTEGGARRLIHGLVKLTQFCMSFTALWSQNENFQTPQSCQFSNRSLFRSLPMVINLR